MKKIILLSVMSTALSNVIIAQSSFTVVEEHLPYNQWATSFTTEVIGSEEDFITYYWEKFVENHGGETYVTSAEIGDIQMHSEMVKFPMLNDQEVDLYTRLSPNSNNTGMLLTIWIKMKDGEYFSSESHPDKAKEIKNWLLEFNQNLTVTNQKIIQE